MTGNAEESPSQARLRRTLAVYRKIDDAVFSVEAGVVTAATALMTLFIFINLLFNFANGQALKVRVHQAAGTLWGPAPWGSDLLPTVVSLLALVGLLGAVVTHHPRLRARSLLLRLLAVVLSTGAVLGFVVVMLRAHPRWSCLILTAVGSGWGANWLVRGQNRPARRGLSAAILLVATLSAVWFCSRLPENFSAWTNAWALFLLLWMGFLGASMATSRGRNLRIDAVRKAVPERHMPKYNALSFAVAALFSGLFCYLAIVYTGNRIGETVSGEIPEWIKVLAIPVALGFTTLRFAGRAVLAAMGHVETLGGEVPLPDLPAGESS